jgi:hypothetical protein
MRRSGSPWGSRHQHLRTDLGDLTGNSGRSLTGQEVGGRSGAGRDRAAPGDAAASRHCTLPSITPAALATMPLPPGTVGDPYPGLEGDPSITDWLAS